LASPRHERALQAGSEPSLTVDRGELAEVDWFAREALPDDLAPYVGSVIARAPALGG